MIKDFEELCDIIWKSHPDWKVLQEDIDSGKHDCTNYSYLLQYKDGELYTFDIERSYNEGLDPCNTIMYPFTPDKAEITGEYKQYTYQIKKES